jgi:hypothetical protein
MAKPLSCKILAKQKFVDVVQIQLTRWRITRELRNESQKNCAAPHPSL